MTDHDMITALLYIPLQIQHHFCKERIVQAGQDTADDVRAPGAEASGQQVDLVAVLPAKSQDSVAGLFAHTGRAV